MNREIKFRIWNGMEMVYDVTVGRFGVFYVNPENGDGLNPQNTASLTVNTTKYHEGTPLMQFTGLQDKNGVDIYEGDILSERWKVEVYQHDKGTFMVAFHTNPKGNNPMILKKYLDSRLIAGDDEALYVVGNIHDNPELLTK